LFMNLFYSTLSPSELLTNLIRNTVPVQFSTMLALRMTAHSGVGRGRINDKSKKITPPNTNRIPLDTWFMIFPPEVY
ncbi:hypothetical protein R0K17_27005, partial [Planococcus sp. SIMBA_143]